MRLIIEVGEPDNGEIPVEIRYEPQPGDAEKQLKKMIARHHL